MTSPKGEFTLDAIATAVIDAFPKLSVAVQRVSLPLYRLLAQGHPAEVQRSVIESFCCHLHFFVSTEAGEKWVGERPGTFLLSVSDAWQIGIRKNAAQFADIR